MLISQSKRNLRLLKSLTIRFKRKLKSWVIWIINKDLWKYEDEIDLQEKIKNIIMDQILNITAMKERIEIVKEEYSRDEKYSKKEKDQGEGEIDNKSFISDTSFYREIDEAVSFWKLKDFNDFLWN